MTGLTLDIATVAQWAVAFVSIGGACGYVMKLVTGDLRRENAELKHSLKNVIARQDGLERQRHSDLERIVRIETALHAIERMEKTQDKILEMLMIRKD